jgi:hydrogenase nickel incorporation protein HypA/HybF
MAKNCRGFADMHEFSIVSSLLEQVLEIAKSNNALKVNEVEIEAGVIRQIVPEIMTTAWESIIVDTIADGSVLKITVAPAIAKCRICENQFELKVDNYLCPECLKADVDFISGNDIMLKSIECQTLNEQEEPDED